MRFSEHEFWFCLFVYTEWLRVALGHSSELEGKVRVHQVLGLVRQKKPDDDNERNSKAPRGCASPKAGRHHFLKRPGSESRDPCLKNEACPPPHRGPVPTYL